MSARLWIVVLMLGGGGGWFLISWGLMGTEAGLAADEAIGAALGLLILVSIVGVVRQRHRSVGK